MKQAQDRHLLDGNSERNRHPPLEAGYAQPRFYIVAFVPAFSRKIKTETSCFDAFDVV